MLHQAVLPGANSQPRDRVPGRPRGGLSAFPVWNLERAQAQGGWGSMGRVGTLRLLV